jgi:hypothetical protein
LTPVSPHRIPKPQPVRGRPSAGGDAEIDVRLDRSQILAEAEEGLDIGGEALAGPTGIVPGDPIKLEVIDPGVCDHLAADRAEAFKIPRTGQGKPVLASVLETLLLGLPIAAKGR